jgi:hypothetical protein
LVQEFDFVASRYPITQLSRILSKDNARSAREDRQDPGRDHQLLEVSLEHASQKNEVTLFRKRNEGVIED